MAEVILLLVSIGIVAVIGEQDQRGKLTPFSKVMFWMAVAIMFLICTGIWYWF